MPVFHTFEYQGYQIGIRKHEKRTGKVRRLARDWKYVISPLFNGRRITLDLLIVATKRANKSILNYEWKFLSPDGSTHYKHGKKSVEVTSGKPAVEIMELGHISIAGQYRLDIIVSNSLNNETITETEDFYIHDFGTLEHGQYQNIITICITVILTICINFYFKGCGFQP